MGAEAKNALKRTAGRKPRLLEVGPRRMPVNIDRIPVIDTGPEQRALIEPKAQPANEVQR